MDAEIQAMDGSLTIASMLHFKANPSPWIAIHGRWIPASMPE